MNTEEKLFTLMTHAEDLQRVAQNSIQEVGRATQRIERDTGNAILSVVRVGIEKNLQETKTGLQEAVTGLKQAYDKANGTGENPVVQKVSSSDGSLGGVHFHQNGVPLPFQGELSDQVETTSPKGTFPLRKTLSRMGHFYMHITHSGGSFLHARQHIVTVFACLQRFF